jgi:hypothetical protein
MCALAKFSCFVDGGLRYKDNIVFSRKKIAWGNRCSMNVFYYAADDKRINRRKN